MFYCGYMLSTPKRPSSETEKGRLKARERHRLEAREREKLERETG